MSNACLHLSGKRFYARATPLPATISLSFHFQMNYYREVLLLGRYQVYYLPLQFHS